MEGFEQPKKETQSEHKRSEALARQFENTEKYTYGSTTIEAFDVQAEELKTEA